MEDLLEFLSEEPACKRCEIRFMGEDENYAGNISSQPNWEVRVWSQRLDGTKYKEPGVGMGRTISWAAHRALTDYFEKPR
jgi:hypothetical protein